MAPATYTSYDEAAAAYLAAFRGLLAVPAAPGKAVRRAAPPVPAQALITQAGAIADISAGLVTLGRSYLDDPDPALRQGMGGQFLAQAAAELQVATELLQLSEAPPADAPRATKRAAGGSQLAAAVASLEKAMQAPLSRGLGFRPRPRAEAPTTIDGAKTALRDAASTAASAMALRVREFGGDVAFDLVFSTEWGAVIEGAGLLRTDISEKLESLKQGAGALFTRAVTAAARTLLNVYDKLMALLGKDVHDAARTQAKEMLDKIKQDGKIELFATLIDSLYKVEAFKKDLDGWLEKTGAEVAALNKTTGQVTALSTGFTSLVERMKTLESAASLAKAIKLPQALAIVAGFQVILLAVLLQAGADYIGYRQARLLNLTKGVAEVVQEALVPAATG